MPTLDASFDEHRAQVYAWAYRLLQNHHDALDVCQEVLLRWWRARQVESAEPANPIGWLRRVTVNLAIDAVRSARRRPSVRPVGDTGATVDADPVLRETAGRIAAALEELSERQRCIVVAKVYDDLTFAQIAEQLGTAVPTVKTHYLRALQALRGRLGAESQIRRQA